MTGVKPKRAKRIDPKRDELAAVVFDAVASVEVGMGMGVEQITDAILDSGWYGDQLFDAHAKGVIDIVRVQADQAKRAAQWEADRPYWEARRLATQVRKRWEERGALRKLWDSLTFRPEPPTWQEWERLNPVAKEQD